jgi:ABC-type phosphate transport system permease subunit
MILESYLLYQNYNKNKKQVNNKDVLFVANKDEDNDNSSGMGIFIFLILLIFISLAIAIACAYFLYSCIKNQCMGFLVFVLVVVLLNVPFINIAIFFILLFWWLMKCRKPGKCSGSSI